MSLLLAEPAVKQSHCRLFEMPLYPCYIIIIGWQTLVICYTYKPMATSG